MEMTMDRIRRASLLCAIMSSVAACASLPRGPAVFGGEYFYNFEYAVLTPDGSKARWCVHGDMSKAELLATDTSQPWGTSHVVVEGTLGPTGHYGNLGSCERVLTVTKILNVSDMKGRE